MLCFLCICGNSMLLSGMRLCEDLAADRRSLSAVGGLYVGHELGSPLMKLLLSASQLALKAFNLNIVLWRSMAVPQRDTATEYECVSVVCHEKEDALPIYTLLLTINSCIQRSGVVWGDLCRQSRLLKLARETKQGTPCALPFMVTSPGFGEQLGLSCLQNSK